MPVRNRIAELHGEIAGWRRELHEHPELMFDTFRTAGFVAGKLREFGCDEVVTGIGRTGVVGVIKGRSSSSGRAVGLRADMDALPIREETGLPYASRADGKMHACGHDGHTAMLLGASKYLVETRNFDGSAVVIFQPAEEEGGGGKAMVDDGLMERFGIQEVYGMHNMPGLSAGQFAIRPGPFLASADQFTIHVEGVGGHAAEPHTAVDAALVAGHILVALQSIASRSADPTCQLVVSATSILAGGEAFNVIPGRAELRGTVRAMDSGIRDMAEAALGKIARGVASGFGAKARVDYERGYPVMANAERETGFAAEAARRVAGGVVTDAAQLMSAEDFAYMLDVRPGAYILIGNGDSAMVHHPKYDFNDDAIPAGCSWWVEIAESRMPVGREDLAG